MRPHKNSTGGVCELSKAASHQVCPGCLTPEGTLTFERNLEQEQVGPRVSFKHGSMLKARQRQWRGERLEPLCEEASSSACLDRKKDTWQKRTPCLTHIFSLVLSVAGLGPGTHLFAGPLVSVHLHHALAEHVKRVFFLLRPVSPKALSF